MEEYNRSRTGPLTVLPVSMSYVPVAHFTPQQTLEALIPTHSDTETSAFTARRKILCHRFTTSPATCSLGHVEFVFDLGNWNAAFAPPSLADCEPKKKYASMLQILQYPFSKGSVHITSTQPGNAGLAVNPQYLSGFDGHLDLEVAAHAHRFSEKIGSTQPLASIIRGQVFPRPEEVSTDAELKAWLKDNFVTDWHPVATCSMGGRGREKDGVVDERLRVYGVQGLRVADASIMPLQISAHLQATVYAIAEKAASMILEDHGLNTKG